jgi:hypothetical protein
VLSDDPEAVMTGFFFSETLHQAEPVLLYLPPSIEDASRTALED